MKFVLVLINTVAFLVSCGGNGNSVSQLGERGELLRDLNIEIQGAQRDYHLYVPEDPSSASMVFLLHGNTGGSSDQILGLNGRAAPHKVWMDIAMRENLLLVVPNGATGANGHEGWNDCRISSRVTPETDDVLFISTLIDQVSEDYQRSNTNVFVVGTSNGGMMAMRLAQEIPEKLLAFASIVASFPSSSGCADTNAPISALFMNGTADPILPYQGGRIRPNRGDFLSTEDAVDIWVTRNQVSLPAIEAEIPDNDPNDESTVRSFTYTSDQTGTKIIHYEVVGGGHTEPSIAERYSSAFKLIVGVQNGDIEMADEVWEFFSSLTR